MSAADDIARALRRENERAARAPALEAARKSLSDGLRAAHKAGPSRMTKVHATATTNPLLPEEKSGDMNAALRSGLSTLVPVEEAE